MEDMMRSSEGMEPSSCYQERNNKHRVVLLNEVEIPADKFVGNQDIQEVECVEGVCKIGDRAFKRCTSLRTLSLPSTLEMLGRNACLLCESLVSVTFSEPSDAGYRDGGGLKTVQKGTFFGCCSLMRINIPLTVEKIESCAFEDCISLQELQLQNHLSLRTIGERALEGCTLLREIHLPASVTVIEERAFKECICLVRVRLQEGLLKIGDRAFEQCNCLESITIPSTVTVLPYGVFGQCTSLVDVTLQEGLKTLGTCVFKSCASLRRIKIPSTVNTIGSSCFHRCTALRDVQFSSLTGLKSLGQFAFANCRSLFAISLPRSLDAVGVRAFQGCSKLVTVEFSAGCTAKLGLFTFDDCLALTNILIPTSMHDNVHGCGVFDGCQRLHKAFDGRDISPATAERFQQYPIHEKCYHSSETTVRELQVSIESITTLDDTSLLGHQDIQHLVDSFGMTPFHLVMSSAKCRQDLLKVLLDQYPSYILGRKDIYGKRATDYLFGCDWTDDTKSLMQLTLKAWTIDRLHAWGLEGWQEEMSHRLDDFLNEQNQGPRERRLDNIGAVMERYERFEATCFLELWLWKMKIKSSSLHEIEWDVSHRSSCRFQCGAPFIVPVVLGWLDKVPEGY